MHAPLRLSWLLAGLALLALLVQAAPAEAARKRKRQPPLSVVVLPFEGENAGGRAAKEAVEKQLAKVRGVTVKKSGPVEVDLKRAGKKRAFTTRVLAATLRKRKVDVLIHASRGPGSDGTGAITAVAYGRDGKPRFFRELPLDSDPEMTASALLGGLKPALAGWRSLNPVRLPPPGIPPDASRVTAEEVTAEMDFAATPPETGAGGGDAAVGAGGVVDTIEPRRSPTGRKGHTLAASAAFSGATWQWQFDGAALPIGEDPQAVATQVGAAFFPGGQAMISYWPLEWLGIEGEGSLYSINFKINGGGGREIAPDTFTSLQGSFATTARARWVLGAGVPGLSFGGRLGYRFWGASVEEQILSPDNIGLTVVPGFALHALSVGAEIGLPLRVADRLFEIELRGDALPVTNYEEFPDNPGQRARAFGWSASLLARYEIASGFFAEAGGHTVGASTEYEGEAIRQTLLAGDEVVSFGGGNVLNFGAGFHLGVGYLF